MIHPYQMMAQKQPMQSQLVLARAKMFELERARGWALLQACQSPAATAIPARLALSPRQT
jgi:hypothetical protein